eukprot:TRINITY_DN5155_c0_g1_i1.p2 TRINITY_DN5155_c0_g1~~TRINITY_DN5155_c0_g1_i1.p2  ORF type:complete len:191 (+),score=18.53 TRINITY_DN5155_c0_g1_i1:66-638(+)
MRKFLCPSILGSATQELLAVQRPPTTQSLTETEPAIQSFNMLGQWYFNRLDTLIRGRGSESGVTDTCIGTTISKRRFFRWLRSYCMGTNTILEKIYRKEDQGGGGGGHIASELAEEGNEHDAECSPEGETTKEDEQQQERDLEQQSLLTKRRRSFAEVRCWLNDVISLSFTELVERISLCRRINRVITMS